MVLDQILEIENDFIASRKKVPTTLKIGYSLYLMLITELEESYFIGMLHGMKIVIQAKNRIDLE